MTKKIEKKQGIERNTEAINKIQEEENKSRVSCYFDRSLVSSGDDDLEICPVP